VLVIASESILNFFESLELFSVPLLENW